MTTIGRVDFTVDFDGKTLPAQARQIGKKMGSQLSQNMSKSVLSEMPKFGRDLAEKMDKNGSLGANSLTNAFKAQIKRRRQEFVSTIAQIFENKEAFATFVSGADDVSAGLDKVEAALKRAKDAGAITDKEFRSLSLSGKNWGGTLLDVEREAKRLAASVDSNLNPSLDGFNRRSKDADRNSKKLKLSWKQLPHGFREIAVIVIAIAAAGQQIAALSSLAGSTIALLATNLLALAGGVAVVIAAFQGMNGPVKDIEVAARPAAEALKLIGAAFGEVQNVLQASVFAGLAQPFRDLAAAVQELLPSFEILGSAVGQAMGMIANAFSSPTGVEAFKQLIEGIAPIFQELVRAALEFGAGFGDVIIQSLPYALDFAKGLADIGAQFNKWADSEEGRASITEWFENGQRLGEPFLELLGKTGQMLADLVTPAAIERTERFLTVLGELMTPLGQLLDVLGRLDVFGVLAEALNALLKAFEPLMDILGPIVEMISTGLVMNLQLLAGVIEFLLLPLKPLGVVLEAVAANFQLWQEKMQPMVEILQEVADVIGDALMEVFEELTPLIDEVAQAFMDLMPSPEETARIIRESVVPAIKEAIPVLKDIVRNIVEAAQGFLEFMKKVAPIKDFLFDVAFEMGKFARKVTDALAPVRRALDGLMSLVRDTINAFARLAGIKLPSIGGGAGGGGSRVTAAGGTFLSQQNRIIGEAGPEAVVPLNRPLNQVDSSVRALSAIAQGLAVPGYESTGGKNVTVESGAIQIIGGNPGQTASAVMDRLVAQTGG